MIDINRSLLFRCLHYVPFLTVIAFYYTLQHLNIFLQAFKNAVEQKEN